MKSRYDIVVNEHYLLLRITGAYDINEFLKLPGIIKARCEEEKTNKVLIDGLEVQEPNISTADRYFLGERIAKELQNIIDIAVVWPAAHIDKFMEVVASNRGVHIFVTGDMKAAEAWLDSISP